MALTEKAYLELEDGSGTGVFELRIGLEHQSQITKSYIMGSRGQYIREVVNETLNIDGVLDTAQRRTGFWLDGGAGDWEMTLSFVAGTEETSVNWGDGTSGRRDASGAGVDPLTKMQVLEWWVANTRSDSFGYSRIHVGEWTDGSYPESGSGKFGMPMPIAVQETDFRKPPDDTTIFEGSITFSHVALAPAASGQLASWAETAVTSGNTPTIAEPPEGVLGR